MKTRFLLALFACAAILPDSVSAQLVVVFQDRRASASAFVTSGEDFDTEQHSEVAPDTAPFDVSLIADAAIADGDATGSATQNSVITTGSLRAEGGTDANAVVFAEAATAYSASQSNFAVRFMLMHPVAYSLVGFVESVDGGVVTLQLSRPFETVAWASATDERIDVDQEGSLDADTYDLNITCSAVSQAFAPGQAEQRAGLYEVLLVLGQATDAPLLAKAPVGAFPNPFHESTRLALPDGAREVRIVDASGRVVRNLAASASVLFDGRDAAGRPLASGVYWARFVGAEESDPIRLVRLR